MGRLHTKRKKEAGAMQPEAGRIKEAGAMQPETRRKNEAGARDRRYWSCLCPTASKPHNTDTAYI